MHTPISEMAKFKEKCKNEYATPFNVGTMGRNTKGSLIMRSEGYTRLNYETNMDHFAEHWTFLWECACLMTNDTSKPPTTSEALNHISEGFAAQGEKESMKSFFSRLLVAYSLTKADLDSMTPSRIDMLPHYDLLVPVIYAKATKKYTQKVKQLLKNSRQIRANDMTLETVMDLYLEAAEFQDRDTSELDRALDDKPPTEPKDKDKGPKKDKKGKANEGKPAEEKQQDRKPPAKQNDAPREYIPVDDFPDNPNVGADQEQQAKWRNAGLCGNCGGDHQYHSCPWKRLDKRGDQTTVQWWKPHNKVETPPAQKSTMMQQPKTFPATTEQPQELPNVGETPAAKSAAVKTKVKTAAKPSEEPARIRTAECDDDPLPNEMVWPPLYPGATTRNLAAMTRLTSHNAGLPEPQPKPSVLEMILYCIINMSMSCWNIMKPTIAFITTYTMAMWMTIHIMDAMIGSPDTNDTYTRMIEAVIRMVMQGTALALVTDDPRLLNGKRIASKILSGKTIATISMFALCIWMGPTHSPHTEWFPVQRTQFSYPVQSVTDNVVVFNGFVGNDKHNATRVTIGPDTFSDITLIPAKQVHPDWKQFTLPPISLVGIGGKKTDAVVQAVQVPLRLQWGAPVTHIVAYIADTPEDVDILMGKDVLSFLKTDINTEADRATFKLFGMAVPLSTISQNNARLQTRPLNILSTCSGCNLVYGTWRNLLRVRY